MTGDAEVLLAEYNNCAEVANHIDNVRNVITSFFLTINGGVLVVLSFVSGDSVDQATLGSPRALLGGLMLAVCLLGTLFTATVARLRRVQTERYRIANGILDYLLGSEARLVVPLANASLSKDAGGSALGRRSTGSYLWSLAIMLPTAGLAGLTAYYLGVEIHGIVGGPLSWVIAFGMAGVVLATEDAIYFRLAVFNPDLVSIREPACPASPDT